MYSIGGCLYYDGSASQLQFIIRNATIETSYSRNDGGAIYILPSESYNRIELEKLIVIDCFSMQNLFFSYKIPKLESIDTQIMIKNINFYSTELSFKDLFNPQMDQLNRKPTKSLIPILKFLFNTDILLFQIDLVSFLIKMKQAYNIYLSNITVQNSIFLQSPLIELNLKEKCFGKIVIYNLHISHVDQFKKSIQEGQCKEMKSVKTSILECPLQLPTTLWSQQFIDNTQMIKNQLLCHQLLMFQNKPFNFSLINIESLDNTHQIVVKNMILQNVNCNDCLYGLLEIFESQQQRSESLQFQSIKIENCISGQAGCLSILKNKVDVEFRKELSQSNRLLQHSNLEDIEFKLDCLTVYFGQYIFKQFQLFEIEVIKNHHSKCCVINIKPQREDVSLICISFLYYHFFVFFFLIQENNFFLILKQRQLTKYFHDEKVNMVKLLIQYLIKFYCFL